MKELQRIIAAFLLVCMLCVYVCAANVEIAIGDISFDKYVDESGAEHTENGSVIVEFSKLELDGELTLMLSSEEITDTSDASLAKIVYILQTEAPENNIISFPIKKSQLTAAFGTDDINGKQLCLKVNGSGGSDAVMMNVKYVDPYNIKADVNGDGIVNIADVLLSLRAMTNGQFISGVDINADGKLSLIDIIRLIKIFVL